MKNAYKAKKRNTGKRKRKRIILIATEGANKTETNYFKGFNSKEIKIVFTSGNETDPVNMAKNLVSEYRKNALDVRLGDLAFCVVDGDLSPKREEQIQKADRILRETGSTIVSNPCIEIWFLCHYTNSTQGYNKSKDAEDRLKYYLPEYKKNIRGLKEILDNSSDNAINNAINNAKHLENIQLQVGKKLHTCDFQPTTEVYKVVEALIEKP